MYVMRLTCISNGDSVSLMNPTELTRERIAAEVRAGLARKNMKRGELAEKLGIDRRTLADRLKGKRPFDTDQLIAISSLLDIPFAMFFEGDAA